MKLGIVGTGTIVEEVLPVLQQVKGLSCYGICGTKRSEAKAEKLKEQYQMKLAVSDYEKLLDSEIDTVYIAVPNLLHFEMAKEAVNAASEAKKLHISRSYVSRIEKKALMLLKSKIKT